jgi:hypothetical protein
VGTTLKFSIEFKSCKTKIRISHYLSCQISETEMVVDVYRMRQGQVGGKGTKGGQSAGAAADVSGKYVFSSAPISIITIYCESNVMYAYLLPLY